MAKFKITGEYVTERARDMYWEDRVRYGEAEEFLSGFLGGVPEKDWKTAAREILEGKKKLSGINDFELKEDGEHIRIISPISEVLREKEAMERVEKDVSFHAEKYIDWFAADKSWRFFEGNTPTDAFLYAYTDMEDIARCVRINGMDFSTGNLKAPINLAPYVKGKKELLDHGAYLAQDWKLAYQIFGEPLAAANRKDCYEKLYQYWEQSEQRDHPLVQRRQKRYEWYRSQAGKTIPYVPEYGGNKWEGLKGRPNNGFISPYGILDPEGNWYNCGWGEHALKAKAILLERDEIQKETALSDALDQALETGYLCIRDPMETGEPFLEGYPNAAQEKTIRRYCEHFHRKNLKHGRSDFPCISYDASCISSYGQEVYY